MTPATALKTEAKTVLITGGCGFIGHHLALAMRRLKWKVVVYDAMDYVYKHPIYESFVAMRLKKLQEARIPVVRGDTRDPERLAGVIAEHAPDKIAHLAAIASAVLCDKDPGTAYQINLDATQKLLELIRGRQGFEQFVFASSSMVYGNFHGQAVTEGSPTIPLGIYGATKLAGEQLIKAYHNVYGLPYTIVRPSALYGPTCINRRVSQIFIENALAGRKVVVEGDGDESLDFTHIDDLVQGLVLVLTKKEALGETFNLTYGSARRILDLANIIKERYPRVELEKRPRNTSVPKRGTLCIDKAREQLGYEPVYPVERGYPRYLDWYEAIGFEAQAEPEDAYAAASAGGRTKRTGPTLPLSL